MPIRDGKVGGRGWEWGGGGEKSEDSRQAPTRKTKAAVDRRQNNKMSVGSASVRVTRWGGGGGGAHFSFSTCNQVGGGALQLQYV